MGTLLTTEEFASRLKLTPYTVREWIRDRKIEAVKIGRGWRIPQRELERIVQTGSERESQ